MKIITLIVLILLVVAAGVLPLFGRTMGINPGRSGPGNGGQFQGQMPLDGMTPPDGQNIPTRPGGGNFNPNMNGNFDPAQMQMRLKLMQLLQYGIAIIVIVLGLLAIIGYWKQKTWGKILAIITGGVVLIYTLSTLFSFRGGSSMALEIIKMVLAIAAIVLVLIPIKSTPLPAAPVELPEPLLE